MTPGFIVKILLSCMVIAALIATIFMLPKQGGKSQPRRKEIDDIPPTVQIINKGDQALIKLAQKHAATFEAVDVLALGTNLEILDPIVEDAPPESYRADLIRMWEAGEPSNALRFLKALLSEKYHRAFDEKILESSDYCTVVLKLSSEDQRTTLDDLLQAIGCEPKGDSTVKTGSEANANVRYSFVHKKK